MKYIHVVCVRAFAALVALSLLRAPLSGQTPELPSFEVASVKPASTQSINEELRTRVQKGEDADAVYEAVLTPVVGEGRVDMRTISLFMLLRRAYRVNTFQIDGPDWLGNQDFEIHATIPEGVSKDLVPEMLQSLLAERFKLAVHREARERDVYALLVDKGGHKLKEGVAKSADTKPAPKPGGIRNASGHDYGNIRTSSALRDNTVVLLMEGFGMTMQNLADWLPQFAALDRPVVDMTGLKGVYAFELEIPIGTVVRVYDGGTGATGASPGADLGASTPVGDERLRMLRKQLVRLGLKLEKRKTPIDTLVIDHIEKNPTED